jgi:hypothetical protein
LELKNPERAQTSLSVRYVATLFPVLSFPSLLQKDRKMRLDHTECIQIQ